MIAPPVKRAGPSSVTDKSAFVDYRNAETVEETFGVIARLRSFDNRRAAVCVESGKQNRGFNLRAGDGQFVSDRTRVEQTRES